MSDMVFVLNEYWVIAMGVIFVFGCWKLLELAWWLYRHSGVNTPMRD